MNKAKRNYLFMHTSQRVGSIREQLFRRCRSNRSDNVRLAMRKVMPLRAKNMGMIICTVDSDLTTPTTCLQVMLEVCLTTTTLVGFQRNFKRRSKEDDRMHGEIPHGEWRDIQKHRLLRLFRTETIKLTRAKRNLSAVGGAFPLYV